MSEIVLSEQKKSERSGTEEIYPGEPGNDHATLTTIHP